MIVEVVTAEVGERRRLYRHAVHAVLVQAVAGTFEHGVVDALVRELREHPVKIHRVRRRAVHFVVVARANDAKGADADRAMAEGLPDLAGEAGYRRLAVGTGHSDDSRGLAAEEPRRQQCQCAARIAVGDRHGPFGNRNPGPRKHRSGAARQRLADISRAIGLAALQWEARPAISGFAPPESRCSKSESRTGNPPAVEREIKSAPASVPLSPASLGAMPKSGARRATTCATTGATVHPAAANPWVPAVPRG